jgi:hypothetical protein
MTTGLPLDTISAMREAIMHERFLSSAALCQVSPIFQFDRAFRDAVVSSFSKVDMCACHTLIACTSVQDFVIAFSTSFTRYVHGHFSSFHPVFHTLIAPILRLPYGDTLGACITDMITAATSQHHPTFLLRQEELLPIGDNSDALSQRCRVNHSESRLSLIFSVAESLLDLPDFSVPDVSLPDPSVTFPPDAMSVSAEQMRQARFARLAKQVQVTADREKGTRLTSVRLKRNVHNSGHLSS